MNHKIFFVIAKAAAALLIVGLIAGHSLVEAQAGKAGNRVPMCVLFDDAPGDQITSDGAGLYCDLEPDVETASTGSFAFYTDKKPGPRKLWLGFQNPVFIQNAALVPPSGFFEVQFWLNRENDADGNCVDAPMTQILTMSPGDVSHHGLVMYFKNATGEQWFLSFGGWCEAGATPHSPVRVTALADVTGDGFADSWKLESTEASGESHWARVNKIVKGKHWHAGTFAMPFGFVFGKE